jgi:hypothetical protein
MSRICRIFALFAAVLLAGSVAWAQSSGNFSATVDSAECVIGSGGVLSGGCQSSGGAFSTDCSILNTSIKTSNGNGVTLLITPSAVTGLFTETTVSKLTTTSTAEIGIEVEVHSSNGTVVGGVPCGAGNTDSCAIYDERFQQLSAPFFSVITECTTSPDNCQLSLILSTLSAHSYNFIANVNGSGASNLSATWTVVNPTTAGNATIGACLGPANVTVTQTKFFKDSGDSIGF